MWRNASPELRIVSTQLRKALTQNEIEAVRAIWVLTTFTFSLVAMWNTKEAFIDYWAQLRLRTAFPQEAGVIEALQHETRGSALVQLFVLIALVSCVMSGVFAFFAIPLLSLLALIAVAVSLGALSIVEALRRVKVKQTFKLPPKIEHREELFQMEKLTPPIESEGQ